MIRSDVARSFAAALLLAATANCCRAHFPWLAADGDGRAILFFGEGPNERDYKIPACVAEAKVQLVGGDGAIHELAMPVVEEDGFQGRRAAEKLAAGAVLRTQTTYGIYNGMLLNYYAAHVADPSATDRVATAAKVAPLRLDATPRTTTDGLEVHVAWDGHALGGAKVTLIPSEGEAQEAETDDQGVAKFKAPAAGLTGCLVEHLDGEATGKLNDHEYNSAADYATVTFMFKPNASPTDAGAARNAKSTGDHGAHAAAMPALPEPLASFGAAVCEGRLYIYGGHVGEEHAHSRDNLAAHFRRASLTGGVWEELPMQTPLQGLPLAAHGGKLYRVGGLSARNAPGEEVDLHSVAEFACFDPATNSWTELAPLPEARSSHDAAVIGDTLYVVGGWQLSGSSRGTWLHSAWSFDLTDANAQWRPLSTPPFLRRALAVAAWNGRLAALGGMNDEQEISRRADLFDPTTGEWTRLPDFPGEGMQGFGVAAWSVGDALIASSVDETVWQLRPGDASWRKVGALAQGRFFHRLAPCGQGGLLAIAGASADEGHLATIERFLGVANAPVSHNK